MKKTVHVYTGDTYDAERGTLDTEPIDGNVTWDEGGVRVRTPLDIPEGNILIYQIPWTSVKYIVWTEEN